MFSNAESVEYIRNVMRHCKYFTKLFKIKTQLSNARNKVEYTLSSFDIYVAIAQIALKLALA